MAVGPPRDEKTLSASRHRRHTSRTERRSSSPDRSRPECRCTPTEATSDKPELDSPSVWERPGWLTQSPATAAPGESAGRSCRRRTQTRRPEVDVCPGAGARVVGSYAAPAVGHATSGGPSQKQRARPRSQRRHRSRHPSSRIEPCDGSPGCSGGPGRSGALVKGIHGCGEMRRRTRTEATFKWMIPLWQARRRLVHGPRPIYQYRAS